MLHPLTIFPQLLSYPFLAYFLIRMIITWGMFRLGAMRMHKTYKNISYVEFLTGLFLLLGFYTQGALIAAIILIITDGILDKKALALDSREQIILGVLCILSVALMLLGPGAFALDFPL